MSSIDEMRWVPRGTTICQSRGCRLADANEMIARAGEIMKMADMLQTDDVALWCAVGGHAFSARDPGRQKVTVEQWDEENERMRPISVAACGEHARPVQIRTRPKAIQNGNGSVTDPDEARRRGYDPDYVAWLEAKAAQPVDVEAGSEPA